MGVTHPRGEEYGIVVPLPFPGGIRVTIEEGFDKKLILRGSKSEIERFLADLHRVTTQALAKVGEDGTR